MYKLIIEDDEGKTTVVPLIRDEITIGRKEGNTIRLTERNVSRKHAKLLKQSSAVFIEDLTSYNGIRVNGDRISGRAAISEGDRIQIGDYQLALKLDKTTAPSSGAAPAAPVDAHADRTVPYGGKSNGAAPEAMLDVAPTVQTVTQVTTMPVAPASEAPARLVVVSSNFAGQEFIIDKAAAVIGRTDENDVVINHRSISRHHAKIVREAGRHHIVDLRSANGVRVNGEEYGKVELRRGDHVDLGHVRLRFVAPGEDFVFDRDAEIVNVGGAGPSRGGLMAAVVIAVALVGGFVLWRSTAGSHGTTPSPTNRLPLADTEGQVAHLLLDADKAMKAEDWELAIQKADEALRLDPTQDSARDKRQKAEAERRNHAAYNRFLQAAQRTDYDGAVTAYGEVAEDSVYRDKGAAQYAQIKKSYLRSHLEQARRAARAQHCEQARQHVEAVLTIDEANTEAQQIIKSCTQASPVHPPISATRQKHPTERQHEHAMVPVVKKNHPAPEEQEMPNLAAEKVLEEAQDAYVHGQYANAVEIAKRALAAQPNKAWRLIGAASCFLKDRSTVRQAWSKLGPTGRRSLQYVCVRNGITVP